MNKDNATNQRKDAFERSVERIDSAKAKTPYILSNFLNYILLSCIILLQVILSVFYLNYRGFDDGFWVILIVNVVCSILAFWIFIPQGKRNEIKNNASYRNNCTVWSELSETIQNDKPIEFNDYCEKDTNNKREKIRNVYIKNSTIGKDKWEYIKSLTDREFKLEMKMKNENGNIYTINQKRWLIKARKYIKVNKTDPCLILTGASYDTGGEVGVSPKISYEAWMTIKRVFSVMLLMGIITMVGLDQYADFGWKALAECIMRIFGIITSAVMGFYTGVTSIRMRNDIIKKNIHFIKTFEKEISKGA